ncbi:MAG: hypothetical protein EXQ58_07705 [Acidobacteria bacterium]|nr:hypothetical protein [Acidobacteriota bacterium]
MFDQMNHEALGKKTLKERLVEGVIILVVVGVMTGIMLYALEMAWTLAPELRLDAVQKHSLSLTAGVRWQIV